jgi:hypothetical protein
MTRKPASLKLIFVGIFLAAGCGLPIIFKLLYSVPESRVLKCETSWSHRYYANVSLGSGRELSLTNDDIPDPKACLPLGMRVEKRTLELGYRLDGDYVRPSSPSWNVVPKLALGGVLLVVVGLVLRRRELRRTGA